MMEIKAMKEAQVPQIAALERVCFSDPWSEKSILSELENPLSCWLVAMDGERLAGYVGSQTVLGETDMMNLAVDPDYRRKGLGKELILSLIEALRQRGSRCLTLEVRDSNAPARALYEGLTFQEIGRRRNYYRNPREDALIYKKEWTL
ncbi:MAG: ribosomal protein S18-alanine N-acetyltransferase [Candidatus Faecousia sp.]|nr:ribosomal protein S18-alanine N-acetyltransferase [Candidatus Faecousia sp.]